MQYTMTEMLTSSTKITKFKINSLQILNSGNLPLLDQATKLNSACIFML